MQRRAVEARTALLPYRATQPLRDRPDRAATDAYGVTETGRRGRHRLSPTNSSSPTQIAANPIARP